MKPLQTVLSRIQDVSLRRELWSVALDYYLANGIDKVSYHAAATPDHAAGIVAHGFPEDWVCHYIGDGLERVDPIPALAKLVTRPFSWSEARDLAELSADNLAYLDELEASGVGDGLAFTVFGPGMRNAYVGLGYGDPNNRPASETIMDFQMVAQMAHLKFCELSNANATPAPRLSAREKQALEWVARGKSNGVIAEIMRISPHTVDTMLRRVFDKLEVADRTTAAVKALGSGLLQYQDIDVA